MSRMIPNIDQIFMNMFNANGLTPDAVNSINNFARNIQGNPQQMVQQLLNNGQMTQAMYNKLSGMAHTIMRYMPR